MTSIAASGEGDVCEIRFQKRHLYIEDGPGGQSVIRQIKPHCRSDSSRFSVSVNAEDDMDVGLDVLDDYDDISVD